MQNAMPYSVTQTKNRTIIQVPFTGDPNAISAGVATILKQEGYSLTPYKKKDVQEPVWKKGMGFWTAMRFILVSIQPNMLIIQGWISSGLGSLTFAELSLDGGYAFVPKKSCMKTIEKVVQYVVSYGQQPQQVYAQQPQQAYAQQPQQAYAQQPQQVQQAQPTTAQQPQQNDANGSEQ